MKVVTNLDERHCLKVVSDLAGQLGEHDKTMCGE